MTGMNFYLVGTVLLTLAALSCAWEKPTYRGSSVPSKPSLREKSSWSSWSTWSACSMTCGQGVKHRQRDCVGKVGHRVIRVSEAKCKGEAEEYVVCNERDCWGRSTDQRAKQCQEQNHKPVFGRNYNWLPHNVGIGNPCDLLCIARGVDLFYNFGPIADGTKCVNQTEGVCLKGKCLAVGCGDRIGSEAVPDKCGVCGGDNMNCVFYKNRFRSAYPESVLADSRKSYLLNGNWKIDSPGEYDINGITMEYSRDSDNDTITIAGPLKEELYLMLLFREKNRGVFYEYNIAEDKFWRIFRYEQQLMDKRMQLSSSKSKYDENKTGRNEYDHKPGTYKPRQGKTFGYDQDGNRYRITTDRHTGRWPYQPTTARPRVDPSAGRYGEGYNNRGQYGGKSNQTPSRGGSSTNSPYNPSGSGENDSRWPPNRHGSGSRWSNGRESLTDPSYGSRYPDPQNPPRGSSGHSQNGYNPYEYSGKKPGYNDHLHRPTDYTQPPYNKPSYSGSSSIDQSRQKYNSRDDHSGQSQHTTAGAFAWQIHRKKANDKESTNERQPGPDAGNRYGHGATTPGRKQGNTDHDKRNGISGLVDRHDPYDRNSGHTDKSDRYSTGNRDGYNNEHTDRYNGQTDRYNNPTDRQTDRYNKPTDRQTNRYNNPTDGQTDRYNKPTDRRTDRYNNEHTDRYNNKGNTGLSSNNRNPWVQPPRGTDYDRNTNRGPHNNDLDEIFNQLHIEYNVDNGHGMYPHYGGSGHANRHDRARQTQTPPTQRPWWMPTTPSPWAGWSQWREPSTARPRTRWPSVPDRRPHTNPPDNHYRRWRSTTTPAPATTTRATITSRPKTRRPYWRGTSTSRPNWRRTTPGHSVFNGYYNRKTSQNLCSPCQASGPNMKTYCTSDFVLRARVLNKEEVSNNTRYAVKLIKTFKNVFLLQPKEYLWVMGTCTCPQLMPGHEFLLSGSLVSRKHSRESRLTLTKEDFAWPYDNTCETRVNEMKLREKDYDMCDEYADS